MEENDKNKLNSSNGAEAKEAQNSEAQKGAGDARGRGPAELPKGGAAGGKTSGRTRRMCSYKSPGRSRVILKFWSRVVQASSSALLERPLTMICQVKPFMVLS